MSLVVTAPAKGLEIGQVVVLAHAPSLNVMHKAGTTPTNGAAVSVPVKRSQSHLFPIPSTVVGIVAPSRITRPANPDPPTLPRTKPPAFLQPRRVNLYSLLADPTLHIDRDPRCCVLAATATILAAAATHRAIGDACYIAASKAGHVLAASARVLLVVYARHRGNRLPSSTSISPLIAVHQVGTTLQRRIPTAARVAA